MTRVVPARSAPADRTHRMLAATRLEEMEPLDMHRDRIGIALVTRGEVAGPLPRVG